MSWCERAIGKIKMNQCPVCSSEIQDSFGLIECPSCRKILFADFDGTLKVHEESPVAEVISFEEVNDPEVSEGNFSDDWNAQEVHPPSLDSLDPVIEPEVEAEAVEEAKVVPIVREVPTAIDEINMFANSEESSLKSGPLTYSLIVKNIDTEDLKMEILEVLKETKLNIDIQKLKFSLPTLELTGLNPIKISVIVSKIKHLPVDVEWVQKSIVSDGESNVD